MKIKRLKSNKYLNLLKMASISKLRNNIVTCITIMETKWPILLTSSITSTMEEHLIQLQLRRPHRTLLYPVNNLHRDQAAIPECQEALQKMSKWAATQTCEKIKLRKIRILVLASNLISLQPTSLRIQSILMKILRRLDIVRLIKSSGRIPDLQLILTLILNNSSLGRV